MHFSASCFFHDMRMDFSLHEIPFPNTSMIPTNPADVSCTPVSKREREYVDYSTRHDSMRLSRVDVLLFFSNIKSFTNGSRRDEVQGWRERERDDDFSQTSFCFLFHHQRIALFDTRDFFFQRADARCSAL
jgi:hypothetical protein